MRRRFPYRPLGHEAIRGYLGGLRRSKAGLSRNASQNVDEAASQDAEAGEERAEEQARQRAKPPNLRYRMIIAILVRESRADSVEDIGGKMKKLGKHWEAECKAPFGDPAKRVDYPLPDRKTVRDAIKDYLKRPSAYRERR